MFGFSRKSVVPYSKAFIIKVDDNTIIGVAHSFKELQLKINPLSFVYHNSRGDFAAWALRSLKDKKLHKKLLHVNNYDVFKLLV